MRAQGASPQREAQEELGEPEAILSDGDRETHGRSRGTRVRPRSRGRLCREAAFERSLNDGGHLGRGPGVRQEGSCMQRGEVSAEHPAPWRGGRQPNLHPGAPRSPRAERVRLEVADATQVRVRHGCAAWTLCDRDRHL